MAKFAQENPTTPQSDVSNKVKVNFFKASKPLQKILYKVLQGQFETNKLHTGTLRNEIAKKCVNDDTGLELAIVSFSCEEVAQLMRHSYLTTACAPPSKLLLEDSSDKEMIKSSLPKLLMNWKVWKKFPEELELLLEHLQPDPQIAQACIDYFYVKKIDHELDKDGMGKLNTNLESWILEGVHKKSSDPMKLSIQERGWVASINIRRKQEEANKNLKREFEAAVAPSKRPKL